jgi:ankyrin repeat protein
MEALLGALIDDDAAQVLQELHRHCDPNVTIGSLIWRCPILLRSSPPAASVAAFLGSIQAFRVFVHLGFNHNAIDGMGRQVAVFAAAGGNFDILRELDNLGVDWIGVRFHPAEFAAQFGRLDVLQWLWTKGALLANPRAGWESDITLARAPAFGLPTSFYRVASVLGVAAFSGHADVIAFLKDEVKIVLSPPFGRTALHLACRSGSAAAVRALVTGLSDLSLFLRPARLPELGLYVDPLGEAILSGSLSTVCECLTFGCLDDANRSCAITLAAVTGHADIVRAIALAFPSVNTDRAVSAATARGHGHIVRLLSARSRVVRTQPIGSVINGPRGEVRARLERTGAPDCLHAGDQHESF